MAARWQTQTAVFQNYGHFELFVSSISRSERMNLASLCLSLSGDDDGDDEQNLRRFDRGGDKRESCYEMSAARINVWKRKRARRRLSASSTIISD